MAALRSSPEPPLAVCRQGAVFLAQAVKLDLPRRRWSIRWGRKRSGAGGLNHLPLGQRRCIRRDPCSRSFMVAERITSASPVGPPRAPPLSDIAPRSSELRGYRAGPPGVGSSVPTSPGGCQGAWKSRGKATAKPCSARGIAAPTKTADDPGGNPVAWRQRQAPQATAFGHRQRARTLGKVYETRPSSPIRRAG